MKTTKSFGKTRHILVVEDDEMMQSLLIAYLDNEGYTVTGVSTGKEMLAFLNHTSVDLCLLDLTLPDEDGLTLARQVRARSKLPIIIMTARTGMEDRLSGLDIGADDFMTKPFDPRELVLRVRNVLNRSGSGNSDTHDVFDFSGWKLDLSAHSLTAPDGQDVQLTAGELNLLSALVLAPNRVLSRSQLLDAVSHNDEAPSDRMIDVFVSRLRKKIEQNPRQPRFIVTVPGHGYKFVAKAQ